MDQPRHSGPRAITRVLDLLFILADRPDGMSLADLSAQLSVPKSTVLGTLRGMAERQYLTHVDGRYRLGPAAYHLATSIVGYWSASEMIRAAVKSLARSARESVGFAIADWDLGQVIYTEAINSVQPVRYAMQVGIRAPLYASAAGRVLLAFAPMDEVDSYLKRANLRRLTPKTRADAAAVRANLAEIRAQGFCASFGEMLSDTAALAVPVTGSDGRIIGAMMLAAPLDRMRANYETLLTALIKAGQHASGRSEVRPSLVHQMPDDPAASIDHPAPASLPLSVNMKGS